MTTANTIRSYITTHYLPHESPATLTDDTPLITGGILDPIRTLKLLAWIEDTFGVYLDVECGPDDPRLDTIRGITGMIEAARAEQVTQDKGA